MPDSPGLKAEGEPPAHFATQSSSILIPGNVRNESISRVGEVDRFTVRATAGQVFQLAIAPSGQLNAHIRVIAPGGRFLVNTSSSSALAPIFTASTAGTYIVHVQAKNLTSLGQYWVGIESLSTPSPDARPLAVGATLDGRLQGSIQADPYRVSARSGQRFQIDLTPLSGLNTRIRVYEPGGRLIVNTQASIARTFDFTANMTGNFIVLIEATHGANVGRYRVGLRFRA